MTFAYFIGQVFTQPESAWEANQASTGRTKAPFTGNWTPD